MKQTTLIKSANCALGLTLVAIYFFAGRLGLSLAHLNAYATAFWPPTGITLVALLLLGRRFWPAIFAGAFLVNITAGDSVLVALGIAAGNTLEGVLGATWVSRYAKGLAAFESIHDTFKFLFFAAFLSTAVSAGMGVTTVSLANSRWEQFLPSLLTWWLGDAVSNVVLAPFFILWTRRPYFRPDFRKIAELAFLLVAIFAITSAVFGALFFKNGHYPIQFLCIPVLAWAAFRLGPRGASVASLLTSLIAVWGTVRGHGPFVRADANESLLLMQGFGGTLAATMLVLAVVVEEGRRYRKQIQDISLRKSSILDASLDCIITMDAHGRIVDFNPAAEKTFGYVSENIVGRELAEMIIPPPLRAAHKLGLARYLKEGVGPVIGKRLELTAMRSDGREFPVELAINVVYLGTEPLFTAHLRDITERKRTEERLRLVIEAAPTGIVTVDSRGKILLVNSQTEKQFGYKREELVGKSIEMLVPERFRMRHPGHRQSFFAEPAPRPMGAGRDLYGLRKDQSEFPVEIGLNPIQTAEGLTVMASIIDITERKKADEDQQRLAAIVQTSDDAIIGETLEGVITSWNKGAERLYGYTAEEIVGRPASVLMTPSKQSELESIIGRIRLGEGIDHFETVRLRKDKKELHISMTISPIKNAIGELIGFSVISRDITEQKLSEEALKIANKRLAELVRMKDEFVASVSHELRTPLTAVKEGVNLLLDGIVGRLNEEQTDFMKTIDESVDRLTALINNLLDLAKMEAGKFRLARQRVRLWPLLETLPANYKMLIGKRVIHVEPAEVPDVYADPDRLLQILGNLFSNAIKFTKENGRITVSAKKQDRQVAVTIEDDGIGIVPEDVPRLFQKFSQVGDKKSQGTGLGLALVKQLVQMHQGTIFVTSKPGKGSRFTFTLPVYTPHISDDAETNGSDALKKENEGKIHE